jgi:small redox-active disulfide protein 2
VKRLQVLGTGCPKCKLLFQNAEAAAKSAGVEIQLEKVEKIVEIMKFGVMSTPALVVDGAVKSVGKVLNPDEIRKFLG